MQRKFYILCTNKHASEIVARTGDALGYGWDDAGWINPDNEAYTWSDDQPRGFYSAVYDDATETRHDVLAKIRAVLHETGETALAEDITPGVHWVYMPDGMPGEWYNQVWPECELLRNMEESIEALGDQATAEDAATMQALRDRLQPTLDAGIAQSEQVLANWALDLSHAVGGVEMNTEKFEASALLRGVLARIQEREREGNKAEAEADTEATEQN